MQANVKAKADADDESNQLLDVLDEVSGFYHAACSIKLNLDDRRFHNGTMYQ